MKKHAFISKNNEHPNTFDKHITYFNVLDIIFKLTYIQKILKYHSMLFPYYINYIYNDMLKPMMIYI